MPYIQLTSNSPKLSAYLRDVARRLPDTLDEAVRQSALNAQGMFQTTTSSWSTKPTFELQHEGTGRWGVKTNDERYGWIDKGTPPHVITARRVAFLVFRMPSTPKTKPRVISSFAGSRGNAWVRKRTVLHPGIQAREFSRIVAQRAQAPTADRLRGALKHAIAGQGGF